MSALNNLYDIDIDKVLEKWAKRFPLMNLEKMTWFRIRKRYFFMNLI